MPTKRLSVVSVLLASSFLALWAVREAVAAFPGSNGRIVFTSGATASDAEIFTMNSDGSEVIRLTFNGAFDVAPTWAPDGRRIAFRSNRDLNAEIYVMDADGAGQTNLSRHFAFDDTPAWSPDGSRLAFASNRDGNFEIYVMNADGSGVTRLTNEPASDSNPSWSPDGSRIAFSTTRDGNAEIYVMNADGTAPVNLSQRPGAIDGFPDWSPDGSRILFNTTAGGSGEVFVMNADGTGQQDLSNAPSSFDGFASWSPDGTQIAFHSDRIFGGFRVFVMNADGSGQTPLAPGGSPDWQPGYLVEGFFQPVDMTMVNLATAGRTIPLRWRLTDGRGLPIDDPASFVAAVTMPDAGACAGEPMDAIETYSGASGLHALSDGRWQFDWTVPRGYRGQCRVLGLRLFDGTPDGGEYLSAGFQFR